MIKSNVTRSLLMSALLVVPTLAAQIEPTVDVRVGARMDRGGIFHASVGELVGFGVQAPADSIVAVYLAPVDKSGDIDYANGAFVILTWSANGGAEVSYPVPEAASQCRFAVIAAAFTPDKEILVSAPAVLTID